MKITVLSFCILLFVSNSFAQEVDDLIGTWKCNVFESETLTKYIRPDYTEKAKEFKMIFTAIRFHFDKSGKVKIYSVDKQASIEYIEGDWELEGSFIKITKNSDNNVSEYYIASFLRGRSLKLFNREKGKIRYNLIPESN